ncbi:MFS transporter [Pseudonocardia acaciae]|uniref:MFS transporter n=1 Tax=Pseudonocardia acaciae TaxID=551276 RepID=UPI0007E8D8DF|nr:MFS transporter [Pseudonocardia acaciae]
MVEHDRLTPAPDVLRSRRRVLWASFLGTLIEWFDYYLYGAAAAVVFNRLFFPDLSPLVGTIAAFGTLGAGFVVRPIGGLLYGHFGDRFGRKNVLISSVLLMGLSTVAVGALPTYQQAGVLAPVLLTLLRLLQGLAGGGEWGGAVLLSLEHYSSSRRRAVAASVPQVGVGLGISLSTACFALVTGSMSEAALFAWGWRLPFLVSIVLVVVAVWIRLGVTESPVFREVQARRAAEVERERPPLLELLRNHRGKLVIGVLLVIGPYTAKTVLNSFGPAYAVQLGYPRSTVLAIASATALISLVIMPIAALVSESVGRRPVYIAGALLTGAASFVTFALINTRSVGLLVLGYVLFTAVHPIVYGVQSGFLAESFDATTRYSGASITYHLGGVLGGGFGPALAASLLAVSGGAPHNLLFSTFMATCCLISAGAAVSAGETYRKDLTAG